MKPNSHSTFCPLPWLGVCLMTSGDLRPCCLSMEKYAGQGAFPPAKGVEQNVINSPLAKELRASMLRNEKHPNCQRCWRAETAGLTSMREYFAANTALDLNEARLVTAADGSYGGPLEIYDVRPGNACNLKCRMCGPWASTAWYEDYAFLNGPSAYRSVEEDYGWAERESAWTNLVANIASALRQRATVRVDFAGGEPLLSKHHAPFLFNCVEQGLAARMDLRYTINLTHLPSRVLELWPAFRSVKVSASLDGLDEVNSYIRFPSSWPKLMRNLQTLLALDAVFVMLQPCVSLYNVYHMPEFLEWGAGLTQRYRGQECEVPSLGHLVHDPAHLNLSHMPESAFRQVRGKYNIFTLEKERDRAFLQGILNYWAAEKSPRSLAEFWHFTEALDHRRGQRFEQVMGEWSRILDPARALSETPSPASSP